MGEVESMIREAFTKAGLDPDLGVAIGRHESQLDAQAINMTGGDAARGGAYGPMQMTLETARGLGFAGDPALLRDPNVTIPLAAKLVGQLKGQYHDDIPDMLSAYNSGGPLSRAKPFTRDVYVPSVLRHLAAVKAGRGADPTAVATEPPRPSEVPAPDPTTQVAAPVSPLDAALARAHGDISSVVDPAASEDPLDSALGAMHKQREQQASFSSYLHGANKQTPEQAFETLSLSAATGLSPQYVADNLATVRQEVDSSRMKRELMTNPVLREYLQDPEKLRVLGPDWEKASWLTKYVTGQFMHGLKQVLYGGASSLMALPGVHPGQPTAAGATQQDISDYGGMPATDWGGMGLQADEAPSGVSKDTYFDWLEASAEEDPTAGMGTFAKAATAPLRLLPYMAGNLAARAAGGAAGSAVAGPAGLAAGQYAGGAAFDIIQMAGPVYRRLARLPGPDGKPLLSDEQAKALAWGFAVPTGAVTGLIGGAAPTVKQAMALTAEQAVARAMVQIAKSPAQLARGFAAHIGKDVGLGILGMTTQAEMSYFAVQQGQFVGGKEGRPDFSQAPGIAEETAKAAILDLGAISLVGAGYGLLRDHSFAIRTEQSKALATAMSSTMAASDALKKFPAAVQGLIARAKREKGAIENAHYDIEAWDAHFQSQTPPVDPAAMATSVVGDDGTAYAEAKKTGELRIPVEQWATKILGTDHAEPLANDLKLYENARTPRQQEEWVKTQASLAAAADKAEPDASAALYKDFYAQARIALDKTKVPQRRRDAVADAAAQMYAGIVRTTAGREGWSINEARGRLGLVSVMAGDSGRERGLAQPNIDPSLARLFERVRAPDGGFTYRPATDKEPTTGFALSIHPERSESHPIEELTLHSLRDYVDRNRDLLDQEGKHFGAWHDPASGRVFLDVSQIANDEGEAAALARQYDQIAYFDLSRGMSVTVNTEATSGGAAGGIRGEQVGTPSSETVGPAPAGTSARPGEAVRAVDGAEALAAGAGGGIEGGRGGALYQSVSIRGGRETLKKFGIVPDASYTIREIGEALQERQREKYGEIARDDRSPEAEKRIAKWIAQEIAFEHRPENLAKNGTGWYTEKWRRAIDVFSDTFPELKTDDNARGLFTAMVAITSDGQKVYSNFRQAVDAYDSYRRTGKIETAAAYRPAIKSGFTRLSDLVADHGVEGAVKHLLEVRTVSELNQLAKARGQDFSTAYKADTELPMAALVFGPKLGVFFANLMGEDGYLTMDRWWSRTFNRYRGQLIPKATKPGLARFRELIGLPNISDRETIRRTADYHDAYEDKGFKKGTEIEKAANTIYKTTQELEDTPFNASDRAFMIATTKRAQETLKKQGIDVTVADIQAALWYYEKRLYGELGARQSQDVSYEEAARRVVGDRVFDPGGRLAQGPIGNEMVGPEGHAFPTGEQPVRDTTGNPVRLEQADVTLDSARGFISIGKQSDRPAWWPPGLPWEGGPRFNIHLLENADESTLAHELSHFFGEAMGHLAQMPDASEGLKRDYRILLEAMGYESHAERLTAGAERRGLATLKIRTAEQDGRLMDLRGKEEALANLFEQYLAEGKAPTEAMKGVFARFKKWMTNIYDGMPNIATQFRAQFGHDLVLSDDVRGVFNRVLGTPEEIADFRRPEDIPSQPKFDDILARMPEGSDERRQATARARAMNRRAIKDEADKAIAATPISQLDPRYYLLAAQRARDAARAGGLSAADQFARREQQYLSEGLYRAARDAKAEGDKIRARLQKFTLNENRAELGKAIVTVTAADGTKTITQPYLERVDEMLSHFELGASVSRGEVGRRLLTADWLANENAEGRDPYVPESVLRNLDRQVHWSDMTLGELRDLHDAVTSVAHQADLKNTVVERGKRVDRENAVQELTSSAFANYKDRPVIAQQSSLGGMLAARRVLRQLGYGLVRAENLVRELDGGKIDGPWARLIFDPVSDGTNEWHRITREAGEAIHGVIDKLPAEELKRWRSYRFKVGNQEYTLEAALAVALNWGSDSNRAKILKGWQHPSVELRGIQPWTQDTPLEFLKHLRKSDWNVVESIWKALESQWQPSADLEKRLVGLAPPKVKPRPFTIDTADGQVHESEGGYYPMIYDPRFPGAGQRGEEAAAMGGVKLFDPAYARALTPQSRLIARVEGYARPVLLEVLSRLPNKISEGAKDIGMREALLSAHGLLTDDRVAAAMQRTIGVEGQKVLLGAIRDAANDLVVPDNGSRRWTDWMNKTRGGYIAAVFAYNLGQTTQNLTGMIPATRAVGGRWMSSSIGEFMGDRKGMMEFVTGKSQYMREIRQVGGHAEVGDALRGLQQSHGLDKKFAEMGLQFFESTDRAVQFSTWLAAFRKATSPTDNGGLGMTEETAVRHADRTVRQYVMAGRTIDKPAIMRNKLARWFIPFYGWINNRANQMYSAYGDVQRSETAAQAAKIMGGTIAVLAAENLLSEVASGRGPSDENDDGTIDALDWAIWSTRKTVTMPLGWIPLARQVQQYFETGRDITMIPEARAFTSMAKALKGGAVQAYKTIAPSEQVDTDELWKEAQDIVETVGFWKGLPVIQAHRVVSHLQEVGKGNEEVGPLGVAFGKEYPGSLRTAVKE